ncbi:hypothetical protein A3D71_03765 [Candidatus Kaiserbacteria bacterium RIFCSPHIGHO2_02_FULL_55_20]|uniref:Uncharacterized protein n=1 Tax=Candidatus Kaiserbacteria bacterium RIFCSPHIGHO2_02_FULL_55_20 TaxID=1798497 RepID=A0A1F6DZ52_9BACT|nr:MAG: hypothetical protein A2680_00360 [Candidatus Kaiserbacteria bacterium RIFCSPHIGHO2_01_FULL_55_37]OGG66282.1 MAG: hypothetical protein A3D71_03765 [Candidatus Kaiserbacteria bacterium RIFCSPHIGHO2_02_FULL_55_20]
MDPSQLSLLTQILLLFALGSAAFAAWSLCAIIWRTSGLILAKKAYWEQKARHMQLTADAREKQTSSDGKPKG